MTKEVRFVCECSDGCDEEMRLSLGRETVSFDLGKNGVVLKEDSVDMLIDLLLEWKYSRRVNVVEKLEKVMDEIKELIEKL